MFRSNAGSSKFRAGRLLSVFAATALAIGVVASPPVANDAQAQNAGPASVADLAEGLLDAVVNISTSQKVSGGGNNDSVPMPRLPEGSPFQDFFDEFFKDREGGNRQSPRRVQSLGSGFVIDAEEGIVVTNNHVIADADEIEVNFSDGEKLVAELIGTDPKTDIAVLKIDPDKKKLTQVPFGDSDKMRIGDWVMAIGNPFGLGGTVTVGIISARNRDINAGPYDDFIQTDASINRGNSGGPLFNMNGEVIGINTAIISPSGGSIGIGFSIPSELALGVIDQLREFGETRRGWLGVRIQTITDDLADSLGLDSTAGALVASVSEDSPAEAAGLLVGDVILRFDNKPVNTMRRLPRIVAETQIGKEVDVEIWRDGALQKVGVTVGRLDETTPQLASATPPADRPITQEVPEIGLTLSSITDELRTRFELPEDAKGVMVVQVDNASSAAEKGVRAGDVIVEVGQQEVNSPGEVADRVRELRDEDKPSVLLLLDRAGDLQFVAVKLAAS